MSRQDVIFIAVIVLIIMFLASLDNRLKKLQKKVHYLHTEQLGGELILISDIVIMDSITYSSNGDLGVGTQLK